MAMPQRKPRVFYNGIEERVESLDVNPLSIYIWDVFDSWESHKLKMKSQHKLTFNHKKDCEIKKPPLERLSEGLAEG